MRGFDDIGVEERGEAIAKYIEDKLLKKGYIVHRYDSISTNSIYLKIDCGIGGAIRIADHVGRRHLNYRFNLNIHKIGKGVECIKTRGCDRHFYNCGSIDSMLGDINKFRGSKIKQLGGLGLYLEYVNKHIKNINRSDRFWKYAFEVKE